MRKSPPKRDWDSDQATMILETIVMARTLIGFEYDKKAIPKGCRRTMHPVSGESLPESSSTE